MEPVAEIKDEKTETPEAEEGVVDPEVEPAEGEGEPGDGQEEAEEVDIVFEGDTQPKKTETPRGFLKRINKLNGKVESAKQETAAEKEKREFLEDENRVLKVALEQARGGKKVEAPTLPNPDDYDGGPSDPDYISAVVDYQDKVTEAKVAAGIQQAQQQSSVTAAQQAAAQKLAESQEAHYKRAAKLKVKDYEETEDKALEIFGNEHANHLIANLDNSEVAFYYFGKNPAQAQKYSDMLKKEPIKALLEIGGLLANIKVKPKRESAPDPDVELEGGAPSNLEALQSKLNKLRETAQTGKGMEKLLTFKKQMKEKGIKLR
jgi:hypothetical protein